MKQMSKPKRKYSNSIVTWRLDTPLPRTPWVHNFFFSWRWHRMNSFTRTCAISKTSNVTLGITLDAIMPVHSILIYSLQGPLLFSKYYDPSIMRQAGAPFLFENSLRLRSTPLLERSLGRKLCCNVDNVFVVFERVKDMYIFVNGTDDIDELIRKC